MMRAVVTVVAAVVAVPVLIAVLATGLFSALTTTGTLGGGSSAASAAARADIPADYLVLYQQAAAGCPGLDWTVLAALGKIETDHGRSTLPGVASGHNPAGAAGPMQILAPTWNQILARHPLPAGGTRPPSRYDPHDAIHAAAWFLCDLGAGTGDLRGAIYAYNHSGTYVARVLAQAAAYRAPTTGPRRVVTRWAPERAVLPDPSGTGGRVTPRLNSLYQAVRASGAIGRGVTCWDPHTHNPDSDHPRGKACDVFFRPDDPADVARGWQVAHWLTAAQPVYGIRYLIWQGRIWTAESATWRIYRSSTYRCPNPENLTGCHYDHIHVSLY